MRQVWTQGLQRRCSFYPLQQPGLWVNISADSARFEGSRAIRASKYQCFSWNTEAIHRLSVKQSPAPNTALMFNIYLSLIPHYVDLAIYSFDELREGKQFTSAIYMTKYQKQQQQNPRKTKNTKTVKTKHICTSVFKFYFFQSISTCNYLLIIYNVQFYCAKHYSKV